jgi:hypothetical protein
MMTLLHYRVYINEVAVGIFVNINYEGIYRKL